MTLQDELRTQEPRDALHGKAADALDAKDARIKRLEGALRPFACECKEGCCLEYDGQCKYRRAREALK